MHTSSLVLSAVLVLVTGVACGTTESSTSARPSNVGTRAADDSCRGPGRYQAGKEGSYRPCCEGLHEVSNLTASNSDGGPICHREPMRDYSCVKGTCGDGVCEPGESDRCGCIADCPSANWGPNQP